MSTFNLGKEASLEIHPAGEGADSLSNVPEAEFKSIGYYRQILLKVVPQEVFALNPNRLVGFSFFAATSIVCFFAILNLQGAWPLKLFLGLAIGFCNGNLAFLCHEVTHGSVVKNKTFQDILFFFGVAPFVISPTFWRMWHNRLHHGQTQRLIHDPDAFPVLKIYKASSFMKFMFPFTPGSGHKRSIFYFLFWFSLHNFIAQVYLRFRNSIFDNLDHKRVTIEFGLQILMLSGLLYYAGPANWVWVFLIPLFAQNYVLMSYISTNHNISPLTSENDPLANSVTVTNHPILEFFNLNFGYHVEHHIFPAMNGKRIKQLHTHLKRLFPDDYIHMPKWKAIRTLYKTPRIYKNSKTLIHPQTKKEHIISDYI